MILFLFASIPIFCLLVQFLPWSRKRVPPVLDLVSVFLKGALVFLPTYLVMLIERRIVGFAWSGVPLFLSLLMHDHLMPLLLALGGFLIIQRGLDFPNSEEGVFLIVFSYLCGFLWMTGITDMLREWGHWDMHALFLMPVSRMVSALFMAFAAQRFYRWEGRDAAAFCGVGAAVAVVLCLGSFLFDACRVGWSIAFTATSAVVAVGMFAARFPVAASG